MLPLSAPGCFPTKIIRGLSPRLKSSKMMKLLPPHCSGLSFGISCSLTNAASVSLRHTTAAALNLFQELPLRFDSQPDSNTTLQLAREHRLSVYDAVYLELAIRRRLPLLTFDAELAEAAKRMNVANPLSLQ